MFGDLPLQQNHLNPDDLIKSHLPEGSGVVRVSQVMKDFMARKEGERLKKMMQNGIRASRFTRMSINKGANLSIIGKKKQNVVREPTIIGQLSRNTNFDYLGLLDEDNKLNRKLKEFLLKNGENGKPVVLFSDYMYKITSKLGKAKRILLITDQNMYSLYLNLTLALKIPLGNLSRITIVRNSSAILCLHTLSGTKDFLLESLKRTELIVYLINQMDRLKLPRP